MATQPVSGNQYVNVGTVGTVVVTDVPATLCSVILSGTFVGSVEFYDSRTAAGTAASNLIYNVGIPLLNAYKDITINAQTKRGLVYVSTGTPTLTFTWN